MKPQVKVLFILKYRETTYGCPTKRGTGKALSSGLLNSAKFVVDMLAREHIDVKLVQVVDNTERLCWGILLIRLSGLVCGHI